MMLLGWKASESVHRSESGNSAAPAAAHFGQYLLMNVIESQVERMFPSLHTGTV